MPLSNGGGKGKGRPPLHPDLEDLLKRSAGIKANGYFLFTGSPQLLGKVVPAPGSEGPSNV